jgi:hypothetical protein
MSEIQIINSMNQSIINSITDFRNKKIKKNELNNYMLLNLCHILKTTKKIQNKNNAIQKKQDVEIKKSLSKIKNYHGSINYNSKELDSNPIMNKLVNPTLSLYIPISEISYSTEIQFYKKNSEECNFNESILFKKLNKKELDNEEKEIDFEEPPIIFLKNTNNLKKLKNEKNSINNINSINIIKNSQDNLFDLINKDDEDLFINDENENQYKNLLFYELTNSFDEDNKEYLENEDIGLDFKKIESFFYLDDIFLNQRLSKRNSSDIYNNLSSISGSTSFGSGNLSRGESKISFNKELYQSEFYNFMSFDSFNKYCEQMSIDYLRYMLVIYSNAISNSKKFFLCENLMFINLMKMFILKIGVSSKKLYDKFIQNLLVNKKNICSFEDFVKNFLIILKLKDENSILKYKFIISLFRFGEEDINVKHINIFLQLIRGKLIFDNELYDELSHNFISRYDRIYSNEVGANFKFEKIMIILESFFDRKSNH